jgi:hypothetical protein
MFWNNGVKVQELFEGREGVYIFGKKLLKIFILWHRSR